MTPPIAQGPVDVNVSRLSQPWNDERLKLNGVSIGSRALSRSSPGTQG